MLSRPRSPFDDLDPTAPALRAASLGAEVEGVLERVEPPTRHCGRRCGRVPNTVYGRDVLTNTPTHRLRTGPNPFGVDPRDDLLHAVPEGVEHWSETMYFHVWDPHAGAGVFVHVGRWPGDLELWWAQVIALLPGGELLVDRSWGRAPDDRGPATGNVRVRCEEPLRRWRLEFDGAGEPTTPARMAEGPVGAGRARSFRFTVDLEALAPVWDMHGAFGVDAPELGWAAFHHMQGFRTRGTLSVGTDRWPLDGVGHRDHSSGPRVIAGLGGLHCFVFVFPESGRVVNGLVTWTRNGVVDHRIASVQTAGRCLTADAATVTGLGDLATHEPRALTVTLLGEDGAPAVYDATWLHGYTLSLLEPNENVNGAARDGDADPLLVTQATVR
ncbi:MAG: hypothetical protein JWM31_1854, partial [Solirubrobacterales bacterium]|nr:hypothetical protein [Solirubrobacterales bacterium]